MMDKSINPNIICHRCGEARHVTQNCKNNIEVNHAQDQENDGNGDENLVLSHINKHGYNKFTP